MSTKLIAYDLNSPHQDYSALIDAIKALGPWWNHLDSTWLVKSPMSTAQIRDRLATVLDRMTSCSSSRSPGEHERGADSAAAPTGGSKTSGTDRAPCVNPTISKASHALDLPRPEPAPVRAGSPDPTG